jgi:hypothetical protein
VSEAIPVPGRVDLQCSEMLTIPHCLDSRLTNGMAVRLSALRVDRALSPEISSGTHFFKRLRAIVGLEGFGKLTNSVTTSGLEPATFRLVA